MSAYISTQSISASLRQAVLKQQSDLSAAQAEVSTGHYADIGLELGARTGQTVSLQAQSALLKTIADTNSNASTMLSATQTKLAGLQSTAQAMLNSLLSTNDGSSGADVLQSSATEDLKSLISTLNSAVNGDYLFAGVNTSVAPVVDYYSSGSSNKQAVDSAFAAAFGFSQTDAAASGISGSAMQGFLDNQFAATFQGADWSSAWSKASDDPISVDVAPGQKENISVSANQPAFQRLAQAYTMLADLGDANLGHDAFRAVAQTAQGLLTSALTGLTDLQAGIGLTQSSVSSANNQISAQMDILSTQVSNLESVDPYEATTRVSELQTQIETSYSLTAQLQDLSLVKYL